MVCLGIILLNLIYFFESLSKDLSENVSSVLNLFFFDLLLDDSLGFELFVNLVDFIHSVEVLV